MLTIPSRGYLAHTQLWDDKKHVFRWTQRCAFELWVLDGSLPGDGKGYWYQAEKILSLEYHHIALNPAWVARTHYKDIL